MDDVDETEELSEPEFTDHAHNAGISTSVFCLVSQGIQGHNRKVNLSFHRNKPRPMLGLNSNTAFWSAKRMLILIL